MPWQDHLLEASFRGAAFLYSAHDSDPSGRRVHTHEFPGRDHPVPEDLGLRTRVYRFAAYVLGDDYHRQRDALIDACGRRGPGTLVHPYLGILRAACTECGVSESVEEGRMARFRLGFVIAAGESYPAATPDTAARIDAAVRVARAAAEAEMSSSSFGRFR